MRNSGRIELKEFRVHISRSFGAKVVWYDENGQKYGLRLSMEDYEALKINEGEVIREINL